MANRPVFRPDPSGFPFVKETLVSFQWYSGFAKTQAQKSIASLHASAARTGIEPVLEISSKSPLRLGIALSAFNLQLRMGEQPSMSVECAFQGSKVFEHGGPFTDLYSSTSRTAKQDPRIRNSGELTAFEFLGERFPTQPLTAFYDWLYITALSQNSALAERLLEYTGFSDIAFNPERSINCQARSAALFVALHHRSVIDHVIRDQDYYLRLITGAETAGSDEPASQLPLWD